MINQKIKFFITLVILLVSNAVCTDNLDIEKKRFFFSNKSPEYIDETIISFLDGKSLVAMAYVNKYCAAMLPKSKIWHNLVEKELGISLPRKFVLSNVDYLINCFNYTFKYWGPVGDQTADLIMSDSGSLVLNTACLCGKFQNDLYGREQMPRTTIIRREKNISETLWESCVIRTNNFITTVLEGCRTNVVSKDGSIFAGWYAKNAKADCKAFRWTELDGLEFLPIDGRSIALKITQEPENDYIPVISGVIRNEKGKESRFFWKKDTVEIIDGQKGLFSTSKTISDDGLVSVRTNFGFWTSQAGRSCGNTYESIEGILNTQGILPKGWHIESVNALSANGVFMAGFAFNQYKQRRAWLATIPRHHVPITVPSTYQKIKRFLASGCGLRKAPQNSLSGFR